ncbi:MAG: glycoside hydrolase family 28 protein [Sediminibacterium sp.]|nr:glycoside hydrolase family 28 protein [Sediminibacterium sp.]MBX9779041.1 glycoside hydrolase family 28 protein [Chitinophagaceae bacterium]
MKKYGLFFSTLFFLQIVIAQKRNFTVATTFFKKDTINIISLGAIGDGYQLQTNTINKAIQLQHQKGGGVVLIPAGIWLTGPIDLLSNVNLHLAKNALLLFTNDFSQYPLVASSFEGVDAARCKSPITAEGATNIGITGNGIVNGNGHFWRPIKKDKLSDGEWKKHLKVYGGALSEDKKTWYPSASAAQAAASKVTGKLVDGKKPSDFESIRDFLRPHLLRINNCKKVLIEGVTFENSPFWTTHFVVSTDITIKNVKVKNPWYGTNTDAVDLESCKNVLMEDCVFDTGDDGITIKSGRDEDGRKRGIPTENVHVKNCTVYHAHGGFVVGSEMSGGVRNIYVEDCNFIGSDIGLRFKTVRGRGGVVENIYAKNIRMKDIPGEAILFDMYYAAVDPAVVSTDKKVPVMAVEQPVTVATPVFRNMQFDNIYCNGAAKAVFVRGIPEMPVQNIAFNNLLIQAEEGIDIQEAKNIKFTNTAIYTKKQDPLIYILNANGCSFNKLQFSNNTRQLFLLHGSKTSGISINNTVTEQVTTIVEGGYGVAETVVNALIKK